MNQPSREQESIAAALCHAVEALSALEVASRAAPRVSLTAEVGLSSETNFFSGFSTDIATGGLFIATLSMVPIGTAVAIRFTLPSGHEISAHGEVRWLRTLNDAAPEMLPGMGIQFVDLNPDSKAVIAEFIASREPMFFPD